ncbi:hypothetical protein P606_13255 [Comamonas thiooxydans]|uniref:Uncharacterized protein n=1 Tax=Comamonas thiooxydans TaxID=363952 RepID=A0A0E3BAD4_9BURK|nr:hypothetical protein P245_19590 [Comamonas thiooxydans]KGH22995.1 hypothetical protein P606_13255 [Comamonas thiooxydans]
MTTTISFEQYLNALFYVALVVAVITSYCVYRQNKKTKH